MRTFSIGLVAPEFPPDVGGVETYSAELARALAALGHRVTVFTVPHIGGEVVLQDVSVLPVLRQRRRLDRRLLRDYPMDIWHGANAAYAWLSLEANNVVLSVYGNDFLRPYVEVERADLEGYPLLWRLRGPARKLLTALDRRIAVWRTHRLIERSLPLVPKVVACSRYTEAALLDRFPGCRGKTSVSLVGVGDAFLRLRPEARRREAGFRLLTVCRLSEPRKNVDVVLRALAPLKESYHFTYTIVGDGGTRAALQHLAAELGLADRVRFTGRISDDELMRELTAADLFVLTSSTLPTSHEGFGIVYLEANAAGVPVLAARLAGAVEAVEEGVSGMFVDEPSVSQVQAAIARFFSGQVTFDPQRCRDFAARFTWRSVAEHFTRCYEQVVPPA
ncbi:MAG: glycosyltransferase family 4 protein [Burkholderiaceae bacterium]|nr:glycosyltransferase family 4 protein [Burkholderiaceae bacterium]